MKRIFPSIILFAVLGVAAAGALAQDVKATEAIPEKVEGLGSGAKIGWNPKLRFSANFSLGQNSNVPGQADGVSMNFGYLLDSGLGYLSETGEHEWANRLTAQLGYARTPIIDAWLKSMDLISFSSEYLYHFPSARWVGPFVTFRLDTPMLPGYDVRDKDVNVLKLHVGETLATTPSGQPLDANGEVINANSDRVEKVSKGRQIRLTGPFAPLTLRESAGLFLIPVDETEFKADFRAGFGVWETFVRGGYVLADNAATDNLLELQKMQDVIQAGPEAGIRLSGLYKEIVIWMAAAHFMQPVYNSADTPLKGLDLLNMEFDASLGLRFTSWASLDYTFKAYKQPLIVDEWQIQNMLFVTLTFDVFGVAEPPPACPAPAACPTCPTASEPAPAAPVAAPAAPAATEGAPAQG
jgi:hypothetical protein